MSNFRLPHQFYKARGRTALEPRSSGTLVNPGMHYHCPQRKHINLNESRNSQCECKLLERMDDRDIPQLVRVNVIWAPIIMASEQISYGLVKPTSRSRREFLKCSNDLP